MNIATNSTTATAGSEPENAAKTVVDVAGSQPVLAVLAPEWERLQLLGYCLGQSRQGKEIAEDKLQQLTSLQQEIRALRVKEGYWHKLLGLELSELEIDILVFVVAPQFEPRLGWLYQSLGGDKSEPYPSRALIQEFLAMEAHGSENLIRLLSESGQLRTNRLVKVETNDPYRQIRPEPALVAKMLGHDYEETCPPGTTRVRSDAGWQDLVLPEPTLNMLHEFLAWIHHQDKVVGQWGGKRIGGPVALFAGPSGTGKTLASAVIAGELNWPLYRVDLGQLVSKYIGETEKNLNKLFSAAQNRKMVLQFDEADSLFSKRGEIKDARDRYANMEVSHLLTKIENHYGPCILTTNLRKQIDPAFARRFQLVLEFPRPDKSARQQLWQVMLPPGAPLAAEVDLALIASACALSGGHIRNAALHACYLAAAEDSAVSLAHISTAIWRELAKEGREISPREIGALAKHLPEAVYASS
ncbi:ATP-binding protein [Thalassomonas haliotis]|uniref:ATP-binding protein n=1 Tax=Thalassomonas haliotis TaxID=485448 RepID=A0ABY7VIH7_9GAMM|nr:ATP-binding protein [Thalassomonas haliotis]WDE13544.1 ATP-binding protein [Thalassomonas haliotis]